MIANVLLGAASLLAGLVALYVMLNAELFLGGFRATAVFLGLPLCLCLACGLSLLLEPRRKLQIVLLGISTGVSLLVLEVALLLIDGHRHGLASSRKAEAIERFRQTAPDYDDRDIRTFLSDHWRRGHDLYPRIYQLPTRVLDVDGIPTFPTSSLSGRDIVECFAEGRYKVYRSDEYGFPNPPGLHSPPVEVVLVGDSFTAGECVSVHDDIGARIRETHPRTLNLGIGGAGPLWSLANLVEYGLPAQPEWVFWLYYEGNDLADLQHEWRYPQLRGYLSGVHQDLRARKPAIDARVAGVQRNEVEALVRMDGITEVDGIGTVTRILDTLRLKRLRRRLGLHRNQLRRVAADDRPVEHVRQVLTRAQRLVERQGGRFVVVYLPEAARFVGLREDYERDRVTRMLEAEGIEWIDLLGALERHPDVMSLYPYRSVGHFNARGYAFVADQLLAVMRAGGEGSGTGH